MKMKTNWGKRIFLGTGPVIHFGFVLPMMASVNLDNISLILVSILGLSTLYILMSLAVLKVLQMWLVPFLQDKDVLEVHAKNAGIYAFVTAIPATYLGAFSIAMAYGVPGGKPELDLFKIILLYAFGWCVGAAAGSIAGVFIMPFLVAIKEAFADLFNK